jgi:hypothetical protein
MNTITVAINRDSDNGTWHVIWNLSDEFQARSLCAFETRGEAVAECYRIFKDLERNPACSVVSAPSQAQPAEQLGLPV